MANAADMIVLGGRLTTEVIDGYCGTFLFVP
jgi:hypothetical protein